MYVYICIDVVVRRADEREEALERVLPQHSKPGKSGLHQRSSGYDPHLQ